MCSNYEHQQQLILAKQKQYRLLEMIISSNSSHYARQWGCELDTRIGAYLS